MSKKNKIMEYPTTKFQRVASIVTLVCVIAYYVVLIACWGAIPDEIPMHYNGAGEADSMGGKSSIIALAVVMGILYLIFWGIQYLPLTWNVDTRDKTVLQKSHNTIRNMLISLNLFMVLIFAYVTWCVAAGVNLGAWFTMTASYGILALITGFVIRLVLVSRKKDE